MRRVLEVGTASTKNKKKKKRILSIYISYLGCVNKERKPEQKLNKYNILFM